MTTDVTYGKPVIINAEKFETKCHFYILFSSKSGQHLLLIAASTL